MVNNNNQVPPTEEIRYLDTEIPSFEEFMRNYKSDEVVEDSYIDEMNGYGSLGTERGFGPCSYSPYVVNPHKVAGNYINMCGSLDCSYYRRITGNRIGGAAGITVSAGAGLGFYFGALALSPFTGGASLIAAAAIGSTTSVGIAVGGTALTAAGMTETLNGVENELKLKWERDQQALRDELNRLERELEEAIERRDVCKSYSDYEREQKNVRRVEERIERIKRDLRD